MIEYTFIWRGKAKQETMVRGFPSFDFACAAAKAALLAQDEFTEITVESVGVRSRTYKLVVTRTVELVSPTKVSLISEACRAS